MSEIPLYMYTKHRKLPACSGPLTGVPRSQENAPPQVPTAGLCVGPYGGPRGKAVPHERGIPAVGLHEPDCMDMR